MVPQLLFIERQMNDLAGSHQDPPQERLSQEDLSQEKGQLLGRPFLDA
ncbi:hypothetical protein ACTGJ9_026415 [Bradyrhizobium sp. RDM12]